MNNLKLVIVGDGAVGKTTFINASVNGHFIDEYIPTVFDNLNYVTNLNDKQYNVGIWDTAGQEDYDRLRPLSYPDTGLFIICFSLVSPSSLSNVVNKWLPEIKATCPNPKYAFLGTKSDLIDESGLKPIAPLKTGESVIPRKTATDSLKNQGGIGLYFGSAAHPKNANALLIKILQDSLNIVVEKKKKKKCLIS